MLDPALVPCPEDGENVFKLIVKVQLTIRTHSFHKRDNAHLQKCKTHSPAVYNITVDDQPAYDTSDLLVRHPVNPEVFRVYGTAGETAFY